jgi:CrcB protein
VKQLLLVFIGGGLGSAFRYLISNISFLYISKLPFQTFISNIVGCLIFGLIMGWAIKNNQINSPQTLLLATGFCGGLTTFSTFAFENIELIKSGDFFNFLIYTLISITVSFVGYNSRNATHKTIYLDLILIKLIISSPRNYH